MTGALGDFAKTSEVGDWKMPEMACSYAASQGWLIVADDVLTLGGVRRSKLCCLPLAACSASMN